MGKMVEKTEITTKSRPTGVTGLALVATAALVGVVPSSCGKEKLKPLDKAELKELDATVLKREMRIALVVKGYCPVEEFEYVDSFAINLSGRVQEGEMRSDLDRDGLTNVVELASTYGLRYTEADSNKDGYTDLLVHMSGFDTASQEKLKLCPNLGQDTDNDGLNDCEEEVITHTEVQKYDTDGDGVSDYLEVRFGMNPLDKGDVAQDLDGDSFDNREEVRMNTPINEFNTPTIKSMAYHYQMQSVKIDGRSCLNLSVGNVPLADVSNGNLFGFYFMERKGAGDERLVRVTTTIPRNQEPGSVLEFNFRDMKNGG